MKYKTTPSLYGAIIGDIAGSRFEFSPHKSKDFELLCGMGNFDLDTSSNEENETCYFTDDTVMTIAVAKALLECDGDYSNLRQTTIKNLKEFGLRYPNAGYGYSFRKWINSPDSLPYNSYGNGSAMRVSAVPYFASSLEEVIKLSHMVTDVTHSHPEGIKGAEAVAVCMWLAQNNYSKEEIKKHVEKHYYSLNFNYNDLIETYQFDETCQGSVSQSLYAFFISTSYEDCIRTAVSLGGDADTMAAIAGSVAGAYYGVPQNLEQQAQKFLTDDLIAIISKFNKKIRR